MARLDDTQCYRVIGPIDIGPVVAILDGLHFIGINQGTSKYQCDVVLPIEFPSEVKALVASLGLGGRTARAMLRRLKPFQSIPPHIDAWMPQELDWRRFQLPIVTDPRVIMAWPDDGQEVHLEAGILYEVRYDRTHEVRNGSDTARVHLQVDQVDATI